jgi:type II secretory pathway pseudopilin PulG
MRVLYCEKGATLLELLIAVLMVCGVVTTLSLLFPKASSSITNNRRHMLASDFAAAGMQELKEQPYAVIAPWPRTDVSTNYPVSLIGTIGGCDCRKEDLSGTQFRDATYIESSVTYARSHCINLVDRDPVTGAWTSYCPDFTSATDKGLKNVRVQVSWGVGTDTHVVKMESLVTQ